MRIKTMVLVSLMLLGRIVSAQKIDEFQIPTPKAGSGDITAGPDGALWFSETFFAKIGRCSTDGHVTEFPLPAGNAGATSIRVGPDGALWFTETFDNRIGRITTDGHVILFALPESNFGPLSIAAGPDGALWFTNFGSAKIGRLTPAGALSWFTIPSTTTSPFGITAGPDGALWISESPGFAYFLLLAGAGATNSETEPAISPEPSAATAGAIWKLTTDGHFTKFTSPQLMSDINWIIPGPDGALWFTQNQINIVNSQTAVLTSSGLGRISTGGTITTFAPPDPASGALALTVGPDGAFWFTEPQLAANAIGRMTLAGSFSEVRLPTSGAVPAGLITGSDGNLWFTESAFSVNRIGRLDLISGCSAPSRGCAMPSTGTAPVRLRGRGKS